VFSTQRIAVIGLGYVGSVTAACLSSLGHSVAGVDRDLGKVRSIQEGRAPFFEPELDALIAANVAEGRLSATESMEEALAGAAICLVCVGTPSERGGNIGLDQLRHVAAEIAGCLRAGAGSARMILAIRSTVFPGTCEDVIAPLFEGVEGVRIVSNPEFLREGVAVKDFREPALIVVGGNDREATENVAAIYEPLGIPASLVSLRTAEMIKYACNCFHAVKISFANEIGAICAPLGIDAGEVMATFCQDTRLNISTAYLKPGFAFGGSCLPKDLRALAYRASRLDLKLPLLESTLPSNSEHLRRAIDKVLHLPFERIGILGLAFKENTDDLRESPVVSLLEHLIGKGRNIRVFDPHIRVEEIYGSNRSFILNAIPHISRLMESSVAGLLEWSEVVVVTQKPSAELATALSNSGRPILDLSIANPAYTG
jgi:GDP-mannose 6-dehydrogenase